MNARYEKLELYYHFVKSRSLRTLRRPSELWFYFRYLWWQAFGSKPDIIVVSYPKSGRTWLERLLVEQIRAQYSLDEEYESISQLTRAMPDLPTIAFSHAGSSWEGRILTRVQMARRAYAKFDRSLIFLHRDPRDVLVSEFYHLRGRTGVKNFQKGRLIESEVVGLPKIIEFMNRWAEYARDHELECLLVSYEELRAQTREILKTVNSFLGIDFNTDAVTAAIRRCDFQRMQKEEAAGARSNPRLSAADPSDPTSFKVRSGRSGEYRTFFSLDELHRIESLISERLDALFPYHHTSSVSDTYD